MLPLFLNPRILHFSLRGMAQVPRVRRTRTAAGKKAAALEGTSRLRRVAYVTFTDLS